MQDRTPVAISHTAFAHQKQGRFLALGWVLFVFALTQAAHGGPRVSMPQTRSFFDAYQVALKLSQDHPGSRIVSVESTYSMYPTLDWDSLVVIAPVSINQIEAGDLVCFRDQRVDGGRKILHRVEKILRKDHRLVTRGDFMDRPDLHPVGADALIGKAVYVVYFDRSGEDRPSAHSMPTPTRHEQVLRL
ncbi:MAG: hypothetical protein IPP19_11875 [Verrucomicrobia bacterium]|nr:hypothetical protein [Verrucomicrobiota bacterium]